MSKKPDNPPAYPIRGGVHEHQFTGKTLRDSFAESALIALGLNLNPDADEFTVRRAYQIADALLAERERET